MEDIFDLITTFNINARYHDYKLAFYNKCTREFSQESIKIIEDYSNELSNVITLDGVYLFGSFSRGNEGKYSDIDVLVVSPDFTGDVIEDMRLLMKLRRKFDRRIEPHPVTNNEFAAGNPFLNAIKQELIKVA